MKILFCWTGVTSYMADCWRALQSEPGVELRVIVEAAESGKSFDAAETLHDLDYVLVDASHPHSDFATRDFQPDVVFAGGWRSPTTRRILALFANVPKVFCLDMPWRWSFRCLVAPLFLRNFLRQFKSVYVPGASTAFYARWLGFGREAVVRGLYAVNQSRLKGAEEKSEAPRRGFLFVGRYSPEKRRDLVEAAYERYRALGGTWDIDYYGQGGKFAQASEMPGVYAAHACLLLASSFDPWPLVALEARSAGLEVIASARCGNDDEVDAIKVPYGDVNAMARMMLEVERGRRAERTHDLSTYDCRTWAHRTVSLAESVAGRSANGMMRVDRLLRARGMRTEDEVWVHGLWTWDKWRRCIGAKLRGRKLVRMMHGSLSPVYLTRQGRWRKRLVKPIERFLFAISDRVVATGPWEVEWARQWGLKRPIEILDLKPFFNLNSNGVRSGEEDRNRSLHVLYLGRHHPLKGVEFLERAVAEIVAKKASDLALPRKAESVPVELREVSDHFGAELEADWAWCDVMCLPTLSENFGLVVAEALERGKRVITTDGAPAWDPSGTDESWKQRVTYLRGYREGTDAERVALLKRALEALLR